MENIENYLFNLRGQSDADALRYFWVSNDTRTGVNAIAKSIAHIAQPSFSDYFVHDDAVTEGVMMAATARAVATISAIEKPEGLSFENEKARFLRAMSTFWDHEVLMASDIGNIEIIEAYRSRRVDERNASEEIL